MPGEGLRAGDRNRPRRWSFAGCILDEASWSLVVDGERVALEAKPLELLRELLASAGRVVSKNELLDAIWPDVTVVEASLPTAVYKLRLALRDDGRARRIIETVPGRGYRLAVPVEVEDVLESATLASTAQTVPGGPGPAVARSPRSPPKRRILKLASVFGVLAIASIAVAFPFFQPQDSSAANRKHSFSQQDAANALRRLDIRAIERMLAAGWNPDTPLDREGNGAVNWVLNICEWDRAHDRRRMLLMVRTLLDGGARVDRPNIWGDTPYSIAAAPRYCGPHHPVTEMIRAMCYAAVNAPGDRCLATYQLARRRRT